MKVYHITPIDDLQEHDHTPVRVSPAFKNGNYCTCKCEPKEEWVNECLIITHNSFDGREWLEQALDILNQNDED